MVALKSEERVRKSSSKYVVFPEAWFTRLECYCISRTQSLSNHCVEFRFLKNFHGRTPEKYLAGELQYWRLGVNENVWRN